MKYIDMHCDTIAELYFKKIFGKSYSLLDNDLHIDINKLRAGGCLVQNFAMFVDINKLKLGLDIHDDKAPLFNKDGNKTPFTYINSLIDLFHEQMDTYSEHISHVTNTEQIIKNSNNGKISALLTIEEGEAIEGKIENMQKFYDRGVRMMSLTWNFKNSLSTPNGYDCDEACNVTLGEGLSETGYRFIEEAERLGIIVDISHISDSGLADVLKTAKKPFVASHSTCRALCKHSRNLTDEFMRKMAEKGCISGINFCSAFLYNHKDTTDYGCTAERAVNHVLHMINVAGEDFPALGTDYDGIDSYKLEMKDASYMYLFTDEMKRRGMTESQIEKVMYKNAFRVYKEILG